MGLQVIVKSDVIKSLEGSLKNIASQCEIFPIDSGYVGISIPTKVVDAYGEKNIEEALSALEHFDLWAGSWKKPKSKWRLW